MVARLTSYKSRRQKFLSKTRFSRVSQTNSKQDLLLASLADKFVARLTNRNFVARLARINTNLKIARLASFTIFCIFPFSRDSQWYFREKQHCKAGEANTSLKTASCEAGPGKTLTHSYESYIWSLLIQDFDDGCCFPNSICDLPKYHLYW